MKLLRKSSGLLATHFTDDVVTEGKRKCGPVAATKFEMGKDNDAEADDAPSEHVDHKSRIKKGRAKPPVR